MKSILRQTVLAQLFGALLVLSSTSAAPFLDGCTRFGCFNGLTKLFRQSATSAGLLSPEKEFKMELIHTNDMHARFEQTNIFSSVCSAWEEQHQMCYGGFARVSYVIKKAREEAKKGLGPPVLALNAGDNFQGSIYYTLFKAEIVVNFMNLLQFDALTLGNHEFDNRPEGLEPFLRNVKSPVVAANVDISKSKPLKGINIRPSVVLDVGGQRVGVIGYLTHETKFMSNTGDVDISDELEAVKKEAKRLTEEGIKIIIGLGHCGFTVDKQIAQEVPELDLVVGAHSHTFLYNDTEESVPDAGHIPQGLYPTIVTQISGKQVPVVQAYAFTKYIGRLSLSFDADGELTSFAGNPSLLDKNVPEDPVVLQELNIWKGKLMHYTNKIEGSSLTFLDRSDCRHRECNIGNVIADAYIHARAKSLAGKKTPGWTDAAIAILNGGSIRSSINPRLNDNKVSLRDIIEALPFSDNIYVVQLKGDVLMEVLEHSVSRYDPSLADNKGAFLQVSGLQITYNIDKPSGQRVENVLARCSECEVPKYYPVENDQTYAILVRGFMVNGGDGYNMIARKGNVTALEGVTDTSAFQTYFNDLSPVYADVGLRISVKFVTSSALASVANGHALHVLCIFGLAVFRLSSV